MFAVARKVKKAENLKKILKLQITAKSPKIFKTFNEQVKQRKLRRLADCGKIRRWPMIFKTGIFVGVGDMGASALPALENLQKYGSFIGQAL